jgi:hypothetical protein
VGRFGDDRSDPRKLALLPCDDHQVVPVAVAEEEEQRDGAVAAHQLVVDVYAIAFSSS